MIKLHKKNLLSLRNKSVRDNKKFKYELVRVAVIELIKWYNFCRCISTSKTCFYKLARLIPIFDFN